MVKKSLMKKSLEGKLRSVRKEKFSLSSSETVLLHSSTGKLFFLHHKMRERQVCQAANDACGKDLSNASS